MSGNAAACAALASEPENAMLRRRPTVGRRRDRGRDGSQRRGAEGRDANGTIRLAEPAGRWVLLASVLGSGVAMLDATVVNVALPRLGADLGRHWAVCSGRSTPTR
jgi:hypothetical protein